MNAKANEAAAAELGQYHVGPEPVQVNDEPINIEPIIPIAPTETEQDIDTLTPNSYPRDRMSVYQGNVTKINTAPINPSTNRRSSNQRLYSSAGPIKTIKTPNKPIPTTDTDLPTIDEADLLTENFVPLPRIAELNEILYNAQTGFTPFLRIYGREACQLCNE
jgi:hypothetical protein